MRAITLVIRRELHERTRQKSFFWSTGITLAIVLALAIIPGLSGDDGPTTYDVGIVATGADPASAWPGRSNGSTSETTPRSRPVSSPTGTRPAGWSTPTTSTPPSTATPSSSRTS